MRTRLPLPRGWKRRVKSIVHVLALSHYSFSPVRSNGVKDSFDDLARIKNRWTSTPLPARRTQVS